MKKTWKILFWICFVLFIFSNIFWIYNIIDMSVGKSYYEVSCNEYYNDMLELKKILENNMNKEQVIDFLRKNEIKYEGFEKGNEFVIILNSFDLTFGNDGKLKISEIH